MCIIIQLLGALLYDKGSFYEMADTPVLNFSLSVHQRYNPGHVGGGGGGVPLVQVQAGGGGARQWDYPGTTYRTGGYPLPP